MALGALRALHEHGIAVPQDIAVTGGDDVPALKYVAPALSTYSLLPGEQGRQAFILLRKIAEGKECRQAICLKAELKLRQSA